MTLLALVALLGTGVAAYVSTNVDDLLLLVALYAQRGVSARSVTLGQAAGMAVLVLASAGAAAAAGAVAAPGRWTAWLGLAPLALGVRAALAAPQASAPGEASGEASGQGRRSFGAGAADALGRDWAGQAAAVALLTLSLGGDNLAVYIPLFASAPSAIPAYALVFAAMTALWCWLGAHVADNALARLIINAYGRLILPLVLTGLGLRILAGAFT